MKMMYAAGAAAGLFLAQAANAAVVVVTGQCARESGCSSVASFDGALGTLQSVTFAAGSAAVTPNVTYSFTNTTSSFQNPLYATSSTLSVTLNGVSFGRFTASDHIAPGFTPNQTRTLGVGAQQAVTATISTGLGGFIDAPDFAPDFAGSTSAITNPNASSSVMVSVVQSVPTFISGSYSIRYTYDPATAAVPEPASWAMMILGMGAIGLATRRRRVAAYAAC